MTTVRQFTDGANASGGPLWSRRRMAEIAICDAKSVARKPVGYSPLKNRGTFVS